MQTVQSRGLQQHHPVHHGHYQSHGQSQDWLRRDRPSGELTRALGLLQCDPWPSSVPVWLWSEVLTGWWRDECGLVTEVHCLFVCPQGRYSTEMNLVTEQWGSDSTGEGVSSVHSQGWCRLGRHKAGPASRCFCNISDTFNSFSCGVPAVSNNKRGCWVKVTTFPLPCWSVRRAPQKQDTTRGVCLLNCRALSNLQLHGTAIVLLLLNWIEIESYFYS